MRMFRAPIGRLSIALVYAAGVLSACAADSGDPGKGAAGSAVELDSGTGTSFDSSVSVVDSSEGVDSATSDDTGSPVEGEGSADDSPAVVTCATCPLTALYMNMTSDPGEGGTVSNITSYLEIQNDGIADQDLTEVTLRYWYTEDSSTSQTFNCDYSALPGGCASITGTFVAMTTPTPTADHYLELSFSSGTIPGIDGNTGVIQTRFHDTAYAPMDPSNDYSFDAADTTYTPSMQITLYRRGMLVWGVEPAGGATTGAEPTGAEPVGAEPTDGESTNDE
jgi:hypothetical protein